MDHSGSVAPCLSGEMRSQSHPARHFLDRDFLATPFQCVCRAAASSTEHASAQTGQGAAFNTVPTQSERCPGLGQPHSLESSVGECDYSRRRENPVEGGSCVRYDFAICITSGLEQKLYRGSSKIRKFLTVILCMSSHVIKK